MKSGLVLTIVIISLVCCYFCTQRTSSPIVLATEEQAETPPSKSNPLQFDPVKSYTSESPETWDNIQAVDESTQPRIDPVATGLRSVPIVSASIRSLAVNKDGTLLAIGTGQGEIAIWNLELNQFDRRWKAHGDWVFDLVFDLTSKKLISAGGDNYTKVWAVEDWGRVNEYLDHEDDVHGVAITADGKTLITGSDDNSVLVRDIESDKITKLEGHTAQVTSILLSPDGKTAFSSSRDETIRLWDLENLEERAVLTGHKEDVLHLAIDRAGEFLASASYDGSVRIWSLKTLKTDQTLQVPDVWMTAVEFSADGSMILTGSTDFQVRGFDRVTQKELWKTSTVSDVSDIVLLPNGKEFLASSASNGVFHYQIDNSKAVVVRKIVVDANAAPRISPLSAKNYLLMHNTLLFDQQASDWGKRVGLLALHGDQFTNHLLANMDVSKLPAPKQELAMRLRNKLTSKYEPFAETPLSERELAKFWGRYAAATSLELPIAALLQKWLVAETIETKTANAEEQLSVKKLSDAITKSLDAVPDSKANKQQTLQSVLDELNQQFEK